MSIPSGGANPPHTGGTAIADSFTPLPFSQRETCEVRRVELKRVCKDVRALKSRKPQLPTLRVLAVSCLSVSGFGLGGAMNYYGQNAASRPAGWVENVYWGAIAAGLAVALVLWLWGRSARNAFDAEIDRIAEDVETLDY